MPEKKFAGYNVTLQLFVQADPSKPRDMAAAAAVVDPEALATTEGLKALANWPNVTIERAASRFLQRRERETAAPATPSAPAPGAPIDGAGDAQPSSEF